MYTTGAHVNLTATPFVVISTRTKNYTQYFHRLDLRVSELCAHTELGNSPAIPCTPIFVTALWKLAAFEDAILMSLHSTRTSNM
jgi:hypothetical protein